MDPESIAPDLITKEKDTVNAQGTRPTDPPWLVLALDRVRFRRWRAKYYPTTTWKLENNLLLGVGFLELGNAGDFAANVWNTIPVAHWVAVLMALGATLALFLSTFAFVDVRLGWRNVRMLRQERRDLQRFKDSTQDRDPRAHQVLNARLDLSKRELGIEVINRVCMDILLGFGALMISAGTYMAIGGANPRVFHASNLLSGYIGNVPLATYALVNAGWSVYLIRICQQHRTAAKKQLHNTTILNALQKRVSSLQIYCTVYGTTALLGGAGSLISATRWWGYVILIPVIISSICCNFSWRRFIGYERPFLDHSSVLAACQDTIIEELEYIIATRQAIVSSGAKPADLKLILPSHSHSSLLDFIIRNDLFEDLCPYLLRNSAVCSALSIPLANASTKGLTKNAPGQIDDNDVIIDAGKLYTLLTPPTSTPESDSRPASSSEDNKPRDRDEDRHGHARTARIILDLMQECIQACAPLRFKYRERYLLELLGACLVQDSGTRQLEREVAASKVDGDGDTAGMGHDAALVTMKNKGDLEGAKETEPGPPATLVDEKEAKEKVEEKAAPIEKEEEEKQKRETKLESESKPD